MTTFRAGFPTADTAVLHDAMHSWPEVLCPPSAFSLPSHRPSTPDPTRTSGDTRVLSNPRHYSMSTLPIVLDRLWVVRAASGGCRPVRTARTVVPSCRRAAVLSRHHVSIRPNPHDMIPLSLHSLVPPQARLRPESNGTRTTGRTLTILSPADMVRSVIEEPGGGSGLSFSAFV